MVICTGDLTSVRYHILGSKMTMMARRDKERTKTFVTG
jgi:hypothetical protein